MSATSLTVKPRSPNSLKGRRATTASARPRRPGCRQCPFRGPWGECRDEALKSGRCGDWVWYMRGGKQCRRLWGKPKDPQTRGQRYWRALLGAASKKYSQSLTDEQQDACIAAGARQKSRPRMGQWGWLTGQQYWVRTECKGKGEGRGKSGEKATKELQTQGILVSTWERYRVATVSVPSRHRCAMGRGVRNAECRMRSGSGTRARASSHWRELWRGT
jgi:hypothetical protein